MNGTLTLGSDIVGIGEERTSTVRRGLLLTGVILVATVTVGAGLYSYGRRALHEQAVQVMLRGGVGASEMNFDLLRRFDQIAWSVTAAAVVGGLGCLIPLFVASGNWRRRATTQFQRKIEDLQSSVFDREAEQSFQHGCPRPSDRARPRPW